MDVSQSHSRQRGEGKVSEHDHAVLLALLADTKCGQEIIFFGVCSRVNLTGQWCREVAEDEPEHAKEVTEAQECQSELSSLQEVRNEDDLGDIVVVLCRI